MSIIKTAVNPLRQSQHKKVNKIIYLRINFFLILFLFYFSSHIWLMINIVQKLTIVTLVYRQNRLNNF